MVCQRASKSSSPKRPRESSDPHDHFQRANSSSLSSNKAEFKLIANLQLLTGLETLYFAF